MNAQFEAAGNGLAAGHALSGPNQGHVRSALLALGTRARAPPRTLRHALASAHASAPPPAAERRVRRRGSAYAQVAAATRASRSGLVARLTPPGPVPLKFEAARTRDPRAHLQRVKLGGLAAALARRTRPARL